jgi:hypothetical protein
MFIIAHPRIGSTFKIGILAMSDQSFSKTFYIIPYHIRKLPGMTLALLDFYETIFEFWNNGKDCYLSNEAIMKRIGIKSDRTLKDAFRYFENHNEMKRVFKNNKRYIAKVNKVECELTIDDIPVDNSTQNCSNTIQVGGGNSSEGGYSATQGGGQRSTPPGGVVEYPHNINNLNINNINKSSYTKAEQKKSNEKKHAWAETKKSSNANVQNQSNSRNGYEPTADELRANREYVESIARKEAEKVRRWEEERKLKREQGMNTNGKNSGRYTEAYQPRRAGMQTIEGHLLQGGVLG